MVTELTRLVNRGLSNSSITGTPSFFSPNPLSTNDFRKNSRLHRGFSLANLPTSMVPSARRAELIRPAQSRSR